MKKTIAELISQGVELVRSGTMADAAASTLVPTLDSVSKTDALTLLRVGLSKRISDTMANKRKPERSYYTEEGQAAILELSLTHKRVKELHERISCQCGVVSTYAQVKCVRRDLGLALRDPNKYNLEEEIAKAKEENMNPRRHADRIQSAIDNLVGESLRGVILACSGSMKSLYDFTIIDVIDWRDKCLHKQNAWTARANWFGDAEEQMRKHQVETISRIPNKELGRLARLASDNLAGGSGGRFLWNGVSK